jgi:hypothetical protein
MSPPPVVDEDPVRDVEEPRLERPARVVGLPKPMQAEEEILVEVASPRFAADPPEEIAVCPALVAPEQLLERALASVGVKPHELAIRSFLHG